VRRSARRVDDRLKVLDLAIYRLGLGVAAFAAAATVVGEHGEVFGE
jgi:hypothetical protein